MKRLNGLDALRAWAILWVMLFHAHKMGIALPFENIANLGWMGVDIFFVLSGYLIAGQLFHRYKGTGEVAFGHFYMRRALRILPAFLMVLLIYYNLPIFRETEQIQPAWQFLTFTQNFFIDAYGGKAFSHAWSLCVEEHFYLVFPALAYFLLRNPSFAKTIGLFAGVLVIGMVLRGVIWIDAIQPVWEIRSGPDNRYVTYLQSIYYPTYTRLDGLLAGVALASIQAFRPELWSKLLSRANWFMILGIVLFAFSLYLFEDRRGYVATVLAFPLLSLAIASLLIPACAPGVWINRVNIPGVSMVALLAYSLYLTHKGILSMTQELLGDMDSVSSLFIYVITCFAAASLLYVMVEKPCLQWRNRFQNRTAVASIARQDKESFYDKTGS